jgi:uncharacterized protein YbjT (DUF2867 family)
VPKACFVTRCVGQEVGAMKVAVAGATGSVGTHIVEVLRSRGHEVVPMSRASGVDVATGKGLAQALAGVEVVIDAASSPTPDQKEATDFFTSAARHLQAAGAKAGVKRIVVVSIIGIDKFKAGYYAAKVAHEKAMLAGPVPVRIVRSAQFHELVERMIGWGRQGEVAYLPKMKTQLVAARTAAETIAEVATKPSADDGIVEVAGPRTEEMLDAARRLSARRHDGLRIERASNPGDPDSALYETDALLPGPHATLGGPTFQAWLEATH